jgi:hypothetical protein
MERLSEGAGVGRLLARSALACGLLLSAGTASALCPAGQAELRPNIRALPPSGIAMRDVNNMQFNTTSWNAGDGKLTLVAKNLVNDPATGQTKQQVDQRIYCSGGAFYDRSAGTAEYHAAHNHVHYNDYANYILEYADTSNPQNPRQGTKTTFCIMDTTGVNTQIAGASPAAVFDWCPTQDPSFNTQGMSIGWGDTYGASLDGQSFFITDLTPGMYRLRHVFDPKNKLLETSDGDNESCKLVEIGDGANGRYVTDRGVCNPASKPQFSSLSPSSASQGTCVTLTLTGANLAPELKLNFAGGTGPLPSVRSTRFDPAGSYATITVCVPKAKGGRNPQLGSNPVWDLWLNPGATMFADKFTVRP